LLRINFTLKNLAFELLSHTTLGLLQSSIRKQKHFWHIWSKRRYSVSYMVL